MEKTSILTEEILSFCPFRLYEIKSSYMAIVQKNHLITVVSLYVVRNVEVIVNKIWLVNLCRNSSTVRIAFGANHSIVKLCSTL